MLFIDYLLFGLLMLESSCSGQQLLLDQLSLWSRLLNRMATPTTGGRNAPSEYNFSGFIDALIPPRPKNQSPLIDNKSSVTKYQPELQHDRAVSSLEQEEINDDRIVNILDSTIIDNDDDIAINASILMTNTTIASNSTDDESTTTTTTTLNPNHTRRPWKHRTPSNDDFISPHRLQAAASTAPPQTVYNLNANSNSNSIPQIDNIITPIEGIIDGIGPLILPLLGYTGRTAAAAAAPNYRRQLPLMNDPLLGYSMSTASERSEGLVPFGYGNSAPTTSYGNSVLTAGYGKSALTAGYGKSAPTAGYGTALANEIARNSGRAAAPRATVYKLYRSQHTRGHNHAKSSPSPSQFYHRSQSMKRVPIIGARPPTTTTDTNLRTLYVQGNIATASTTQLPVDFQPATYSQSSFATYDRDWQQQLLPDYNSITDRPFVVDTSSAPLTTTVPHSSTPLDNGEPTGEDSGFELGRSGVESNFMPDSGLMLHGEQESLLSSIKSSSLSIGGSFGGGRKPDDPESVFGGGGGGGGFGPFLFDDAQTNK